MRGDYLFYEEKIEMTQEERDAKAARRFVFWSHWRINAEHLNLAEHEELLILTLFFHCQQGGKTDLRNLMGSLNKRTPWRSTFRGQVRAENGM